MCCVIHTYTMSLDHQASYCIIIMDRTGQEQDEISSVDKFCDIMLMPCIYVIGQDMLCGNHQVMELYRNIIKHVMTESLFGVIECDITVPNQLWNVFAEMPPIFNNVGLVFNDICAEPQDRVNPNYKCNKLIDSFFGNKVLFHTELLKWYVNKCLDVSSVACTVKYKCNTLFNAFMDHVSNDMRAGDTNQAYTLHENDVID